MINFKLDRDKCTSCGLCVADCPAGIIASVDEAPWIAPENEPACFRCQHCISICPTGAISILGLKPGDMTTLRGFKPDAKQLSLLMRGRRSVRRYRRENVDRAVMDDLLAVASSAPSAKNERKVLFTLVDDMEVMDRLREETYSRIEMLAASGNTPPGYEFFADFVKLWKDDGVDVIYRGAPHLIVASAPRGSVSPAADTMIALTYFELYAAALGLGAVWVGYARHVLATIVPQLSGMLGVPPENVIGHVIAFGNPAVSYARAASRAQHKVDRVKL